MAAIEGKPLMEDEEYMNEHEDVSCGCGCFRICGLKWWRSNDGDEGNRLLQNGERGKEGWVIEQLKKAKEFSEVIAGPKWKTFIRKISGYGKNRQKNRFQYDERSYALNFNSGTQSEDEDMPPSFSARFSAPGPRQTQS
ncbi:hypothetical protein L6164_011482 [Bauhinia variegata]|uniref:Uncharacterized protein n=1 Tax=Bauhinia variegata TaxID=167791 RepID=A0ACB9P622_BAUVA|nr:hypothetical protein L6164_011482 [Bauhinia variegata]